MISRSLTAVLIGVIVAAAIGAAGALLILDSEDERTFTLTYYKNGNKVSENTVAAGTSITIIGVADAAGDNERFVGWNTRPDMTGPTLPPGMPLKVDRDMSLYAMMAGHGVFAIILPEKQVGFSISADPLLVGSGGSSIISYSLMPNFIDDDLVIAVNGNPMKLDAMRKIHLADITEDKVVTVVGVYDKREHSISLPDPQTGYVLTSSAERVHHGESYTLEYKLLPGYRETGDFAIHMNGVDKKLPSGGIVLIEDVRGDHAITVTGVEPILFDVVHGKNISVLVNGAPSSKATVEDLVTILPAEGYSIPDTFNGQIKGRFVAEGKGYRITESIVFPSVLKITAGTNTKIDGWGSETVFVCPEDRFKISASSGYSLPDNYVDTVRGLSGAKYSSGWFSFSDDAVLPSIFKVDFYGHNKVHATFFVVGNGECPFPTNNPQRDFYHFDKWQMGSKYISEDMLVYAVWIPNQYNVAFGKNLIYSINGEPHSKPGSYAITVEDALTIKASSGYELPLGYLPSGVFMKNGDNYYITSNFSLADIYYVQYLDGVTGLSKKYFFSDNQMHTIVNPRSQPNPLFTFDLSGTVYEMEDFIGWIYDGLIYENDTIVVKEDIMFFSMWSEI
ncbi:MAG: InlB B-repeat-containing protein [Methanomassiliicoccaceae archaeon]|nr:InlB B-repeat-containing protein [Methanomassiliicoccaceae archaeon]